MERYPSEILYGISPLIFAVDATLTVQQQGEDPFRHQNNASDFSLASPDIFEVFLQEITSAYQKNSRKINSTGVPKSIFVTHEITNEYHGTPSSSSTGYGIYASIPESSPPSTRSVTAKNSTDSDSSFDINNDSFFSRVRMLSVSKKHAFPPSTDPTGTSNRTARISSVLGLRSSSSPTRAVNNSNNSNNSMFYNSSSFQLSTSATTVSDNAVLSYLRRNPIHGILPVGWMEKHAHALPSVVVLVAALDIASWNSPGFSPSSHTGTTAYTNVHPSKAGGPLFYQQAKIEKHLSEVCDSIKSSLAEKRGCNIHLVCLIPNSTSAITGNNLSSASSAAIENEKVNSLRTVCRLPVGAVSVLHYSPVEIKQRISSTSSQSSSVTSSLFPSEEISKLQKTLQEISATYYHSQAKRNESKLHSLNVHTHAELMPAAARYCVKIAVFMELEERARGFYDSCLQLGSSTPPNLVFYFNVTRGPSLNKKGGGERERTFPSESSSLKFWCDAYNHLIRYFRYVQGPVGGSETNRNDASELVGGDKNKCKLPSTVYELTNQRDRDNGSAVISNVKESIHDKKEAPSSEQHEMMDGGVEVALATPLSNPLERELFEESKTHNIIDSIFDSVSLHADDMIHQCRGVAGWVNFKIISRSCWALSTIDSPVQSNPSTVVNSLTETVTHSNNILKASILEFIASQCRRHCRIFLMLKNISMNSDINSVEAPMLEDTQDPEWYFHVFVAQQRLILAQLIERFIFPVYLKYKTEQSTISVSCDVWDSMSASSFYANSGEVLLRLNNAIQQETARLKVTKSFWTDDKKQKFVGGLTSFALATLLQDELKRDHLGLALDFFRKALMLQKKIVIDGTDAMTAQYNYLVGMMLIKQKSYSEAIVFLTSSLQECRNWPYIQLLLRKAIVECLETYGTASKLHEIEALRDTALSILLNPRASQFMTPVHLHQMERMAFCIDGAHACRERREVPLLNHVSESFPFTITFPETVYARRGDKIPVIIRIQSKLSIPILISDITVSTNMGKACITSSQITKPILTPNDRMVISTMLLLKNAELSSDTSERTKLSKPKTTGLTFSGGSVYEKVQPLRDNSKLGGVTLFASSVDFSFRSTDANSRTVTIGLRRKNTYRGSDSTKRSHYEEDNYLSTSWSRPSDFPLGDGPRSVRILQAKPMIVVTNVTAGLTQGKVLEGTVNRILLEIKAGPLEICRDMEMSVSCSSRIFRQKIDSSELTSSLVDREGRVKCDQLARPPVLVKCSSTCVDDASLPLGWILHGSHSGFGAQGEWWPVASLVEEEKVAHACVDIFRELPSLQDPLEDFNAQQSCRTDIIVSIRYTQIRTDRSSRGDTVCKEYRDSVLWCHPISASFSVVSGHMSSYPSSARHPSNLCLNSYATDSVAIRAGDKVPVRCTVEAREGASGLFIRLRQVSFSSSDEDTERTCDLKLINTRSEDPTDIVFSPTTEDLSCVLKHGTKLSIIYVVKPDIQLVGEALRSVITHLGSLHFSWIPVPMYAPMDISTVIDDEYCRYHGPLPVPNRSPVVYYGPRCQIEETPFDAQIASISATPKVCVPFDIRYDVSNNTNLHQTIKLSLGVSNFNVDEHLLVSGLCNAEIHMGPYETKKFSYNVLATKSGKVTLPVMNVSSERYNNWIIRGGQDIYVLP